MSGPFDDRHGLVPPPLPQPDWAGALARGFARASGPPAVSFPDSELTLPFGVALVNGIEFRGEPWRRRGALIIPGGGTNGDSDGNLVEVAEGVGFTAGADGGLANDQDIVTFDVPDQLVCVVEKLFLWCDSEMGWQLVEWNLIVGGASGTAASGQQGRVVDRTSVRPIDRNAPIDVWKIATPTSTVRLQASNTSLESPHLVEAEIRGSLWPVSVLEKLRRT